MKLAVSNIAWDRHDDPHALSLLKKYGASGVEIAPTKIWPDWKGATTAAARQYGAQLADAGLAVPALQAILFGKPELQLLQPGGRQALADHLARVADLAAALGARTLVFGAPRNRLRGQLSWAEAKKRAIQALEPLGRLCAERGTVLGLEPNPAAYGCDFLTNVADVRDLLDQLASDGVGLHLDTAAMHLNGGPIARTMAEAGPFVHFHASEPMLKSMEEPQVDHAAAADALRELRYNGWVSLEMRTPENGFTGLAHSLAVLKHAYGAD